MSYNPFCQIQYLSKFLFRTFLQVSRDTSEQDFPMEQEHSVPLHKYRGKLLMADGVQAVLGKIIGGLLYPHKRYTLEDNALTS